jgi:hypothetical protein
MTEPIEAACPIIYVAILHGTKFIVSTIPNPAVIEPPGELMYKLTSAFESSFARYNNCATTRFAVSSITGPPKKIIRSLRSLEKIS